MADRQEISLVRSIINRLLNSPVRVFALVLGVYLVASFFSVNVRPATPLPADHALRYKNNYWVIVSLPRILRGDEMYYLMMTHSLAGDGDLLLSDEYRAAYQGGPQLGVYHRGTVPGNFFQHFGRDSSFTLLGKHPFGLSLFLSGVLWPLADTFALESAAIWFTCLVGALGVIVFLRILLHLGITRPVARNAALVLAFASPWFSYSRTLYTEVYIGTAMLIVVYAVLCRRTPLVAPLLCLVGWFKYPALALFFSAGAGEALMRRWRGFIAFGLLGACTLAGVYAFNRWYFAASGWVAQSSSETLARSAARIGAPIAWIPGEISTNLRRLLLDGDKGLLPHCPVLALGAIGLAGLRRVHRRAFWIIMVSLLPWFLVHISYQYLMTGASYSTRYMVPIVPLVLLGLPWFWARTAAHYRYGRFLAGVGVVLVAASLVNNVLAGLLPGTSFSHSPVEILQEWAAILRAAVTGRY